jgi:hypothetical protein
LVRLIFPTAYSFLMISPNLHEIWVVFFLNLSQELKLVLLLYFGTLNDGYSLKGSKKYPSRHNDFVLQECNESKINIECK